MQMRCSSQGMWCQYWLRDSEFRTGSNFQQDHHEQALGQAIINEHAADIVIVDEGHGNWVGPKLVAPILEIGLMCYELDW